MRHAILKIEIDGCGDIDRAEPLGEKRILAIAFEFLAERFLDISEMRVDILERAEFLQQPGRSA